ncbi:AsmA family protein [Desulfosarcina sp. OttesenSCG-928-G10]|nr:AsmA family protein [Desulfosarcina sp. OttesenSCG-928-G10]MDL2321428.1 AsmA family protein [Desulfosarcina sp. OttesenSCG-928-B08]
MLKKILIAVVAGVVILVVAGVILVKMVVTPERVRTTIVPLAEQRLSRKIDCNDIAIGIFSGIYVSDLKILNRHDTSAFVSVGKVVLHYRLLPLLQGKVEISEIVLEQPEIHITRFADGTFNFSDLMAASKKPDTAGKSEAPKTPDAESKMALLVEKIRITEGQLHVVDQAVSAKSPFHCVLNEFNLKSSDITLEKAFPVEMSARINGAPVSLSGVWNINAAEGSVKLSLEALDAVAFSPYFAGSLPGTLKSAKLSLNLDADAKKDGVSAKGRVRMDQLGLTLAAMPDVPLENAAVSFDTDMALDTVKKILTLSSMKFSFNSLSLGGQGSIRLAPKTPVVDLSIVLDAFDLQELMKQAPTGLTQQYRDYRLKGRISGNVNISGPVDQGIGLLKAASLGLDGIEATVGAAVAGASGRVSYAENRLKTDGIDFNYAGEGGKLTLDMAYHKQAPTLRGNFGLTAKRINLNAFMEEPKAGPEHPASSEKTVSPAKKPAAEPGPFAIPVDVRGLITVDELLYKKLSIQHTQAEVSLKNNHLAVEKLTSQVAGGGVEATADVNLGVRGLAYQGKFNLSETDIKEVIVGARPDLKLDISGKAVASGRFSGNGTLPENLIPGLQVFGNVGILDGVVKETQIQQAISLFLGVPEFKLLSFQSFRTDIDMKNSLVKLNSALDSSTVRATTTGTVSAEKDHALDLVLDVRIAPNIMERIRGGDFTKYIADDNGWGRVGLTLTGTPENPKIGLDPAAVKETTKQVIKEKLTEKITEKLSEKRGTEKSGEAKEASTPSADPLKNVLKDVLKKM